MRVVVPILPVLVSGLRMDAAFESEARDDCSQRAIVDRKSATGPICARDDDLESDSDLYISTPSSSSSSIDAFADEPPQDFFSRWREPQDDIRQCWKLGEMIYQNGSSKVRKCVNMETGEIIIWKCSDFNLWIEAKALRKLTHQNIVCLEEFQIGRNISNSYIIVEHCEGGDIFNRIRSTKDKCVDGDVSRWVLNEETSAHIFKQMLSAVLHCHKNDIVHHDLKPQNFGFKSNDPSSIDYYTVKLFDFGHAHDISSGPTTSTLCTAGYTAPEVHLGQPHDGKADIWSLGVILYNLFLGEKLPHSDFTEESEQTNQDVFKRFRSYIRNCRYQFAFSESVWSLIDAMLSPAESRYDAQQCLAHRWLNQYGEFTQQAMHFGPVEVEKMKVIQTGSTDIEKIRSELRMLVEEYDDCLSKGHIPKAMQVLKHAMPLANYVDTDHIPPSSKFLLKNIRWIIFDEFIQFKLRLGHYKEVFYLCHDRLLIPQVLTDATHLDHDYCVCFTMLSVMHKAFGRQNSWSEGLQKYMSSLKTTFADVISRAHAAGILDELHSKSRNPIKPWKKYKIMNIRGFNNHRVIASHRDEATGLWVVSDPLAGQQLFLPMRYLISDPPDERDSVVFSVPQPEGYLAKRPGVINARRTQAKPGPLKPRRRVL